MTYNAVRDRCAINLEELNLSISGIEEIYLSLAFRPAKRWKHRMILNGSYSMNRRRVAKANLKNEGHTFLFLSL
jgi:hypothetical protein